VVPLNPPARGNPGSKGRVLTFVGVPYRGPQHQLFFWFEKGKPRQKATDFQVAPTYSPKSVENEVSVETGATKIRQNKTIGLPAGVNHLGGRSTKKKGPGQKSQWNAETRPGMLCKQGNERVHPLTTEIRLDWRRKVTTALEMRNQGQCTQTEQSGGLHNGTPRDKREAIGFRPESPAKRPPLEKIAG